MRLKNVSRFFLYLFFVPIFFLSFLQEKSHGKSVRLEGIFHLASRPNQNYAPFGFGGGAGISLSLQNLIFADLILRSDVNYTLNERSQNKYERIYVVLGLQLLLQASPWFYPYVEVGPELSLQKTNMESRKTYLGVIFGGGSLFEWKNVFLGINLRYHMTHNSFFSVSPSIGIGF